MKNIREKAMKWYRDKKLIIAFVIIVISFILGIYSKALVIIKFYEPIYVITGLSLYTFSWILLIIGILMVGWRTVKAMNQKIHHNVKSAAQSTYYKTKDMHRKSMDKIKSTSRKIANKIK